MTGNRNRTAQHDEENKTDYRKRQAQIARAECLWHARQRRCRAGASPKTTELVSMRERHQRRGFHARHQAGLGR